MALEDFLKAGKVWVSVNEFIKVLREYDIEPVWALGAFVLHLTKCEACREHIEKCKDCQKILHFVMDHIGKLLDSTV